eukprot:Polyplicarium_translucidae@DN941_c0_g1_i4.p1
MDSWLELPEVNSFLRQFERQYWREAVRRGLILGARELRNQRRFVRPTETPLATLRAMTDLDSPGDRTSSSARAHAPREWRSGERSPWEPDADMTAPPHRTPSFGSPQVSITDSSKRRPRDGPAPIPASEGFHLFRSENERKWIRDLRSPLGSHEPQRDPSPPSRSLMSPHRPLGGANGSPRRGPRPHWSIGDDLSLRRQTRVEGSRPSPLKRRFQSLAESLQMPPQASPAEREKGEWRSPAGWARAYAVDDVPDVSRIPQLSPKAKRA